MMFVCDPVMGDNGSYYVPRSLMPIYRDVLVPLADVLTPNQFELAELTGIAIENEGDCLRAIANLHEKGARIVVVTSGNIARSDSVMYAYASVVRGERGGDCEQFRFHIPLVKTDKPFVGEWMAGRDWICRDGGCLRESAHRVAGRVGRRRARRGLQRHQHTHHALAEDGGDGRARGGDKGGEGGG
jgi:hypothetical protein